MKKLYKFVARYGTQLCALAMVVSTFAVDRCHGFFYQPEEPEGLADFAKRARKQ